MPGKGAGDSVHHIGELCQQSVAHEFDDASTMLGDERMEDFLAQFS